MPATSVRPLCPELARQAYIELNETPKKLEVGIQLLREWIALQPHLRARTDDQWLAAFLRGCKHSIQKAKEKLDLYYTIRSITPFLTALKFSDTRFEALLRTGMILILPKRTSPTDPRVVLIRTSLYDPTKFTPPDFFSVSLILQQICYMEDDPFVISGNLIVIDFTGLSVHQLAQATPAHIKAIMFAGQDASPIRLKGLHFVGMPPYFQVLFNIGKSLLNEKNKNKIHVHKNFEELHNHICKDILPVEYGGDGGRCQDIAEHWVNKVHEYGPWLEEDLQYGTDEAKRLGQQRTPDSLLGIDGTFRQLDID